jgi:hypothetical protein
MNHAYVEEHQLVDGYLRGRLAEEEAARFEEHYLSCPACLDQLELAEALHQGFRQVAGEDVARLTAARQLAVVAWLARLGRSRQAALLVSGLLVLLIVPGLALWRSSRLDLALRSAQAAGTERHGETARLRADLEQAREEHRRIAGELADARRPQANVPILYLSPERGEGDEPTRRLRLPAKPGWVVLSFTLEPPHPGSYGLVLEGKDGKEIWRESGVRPDALDTVTLSLPTRLLAPGDYRLVVLGSGSGAPSLPFRVLPPA